MKYTMYFYANELTIENKAKTIKQHMLPTKNRLRESVVWSVYRFHLFLEII